MSSYFDTPYDGEDDYNKFGGMVGSDNDSDNSSTSSDEKPKKKNNVIGEEEDVEDVEDIEDDNAEDIDLDEEQDDDEDDLDEYIEDDETKIMEGGAGEDDMEEGEIEANVSEKSKRVKKIPPKTVYVKPDNEDDTSDDDDGELYLQKFDRAVNQNYIVDYHPESLLQNYDEILSMTKVIRDKDGIIIDDLHKTIPYLTKYEKSRILGQRAKQINSGSIPFVKVPENVIDGYIIAELELKEKRIPFIIRRPLPNGGSEYWSIKDLEDISF